MSLRPRYSLLTLLVVTALVAGGVKLWRGPHWRTMSTPPTVQEAALFDKHSEVPRFDLLYRASTEYQYRNTGDGPELLVIKGQPALPTELYVTHWRPYSADDNAADAEATEDKLLNTGTTVIVPATMLDKNAPLLGKVRCWYAPSRWLYAGETAPPAAETNGIQLPSFWMFPRCYFVTDRGQVYKFAGSYLMIFVQPVSVSEIPEHEVRELIEHELERLPTSEVAR